MTPDWKSLAKETVHSFDADEVRGMWDVDWQRARSVFLADHEAEIAAEPRRWSGEEFGDARIEHFLFRKAGAAPSEVVSSLVRELDRFLGRAACDDDVSIAAIRHKTA